MYKITFIIEFMLPRQFSYSSRSTQTFYKSKHVKSLAVAHGKAYLGCTDLSIQVSTVGMIAVVAPYLGTCYCI